MRGGVEDRSIVSRLGGVTVLQCTYFQLLVRGTSILSHVAGLMLSYSSPKGTCLLDGGVSHDMNYEL